MGGIFSHNLRDRTTHLMIGKAGSQKHIVSTILYYNLFIIIENFMILFRKLLKME